MISFCNKPEYCTKCRCLCTNYYKRSCVVLCHVCINDLCNEYYKYKREKFFESDYDSFREFLENE